MTIPNGPVLGGKQPSIGPMDLGTRRGVGGSVFDPRNIPGLAAWYDASQEATTNGGAVSTFHDRSGNGRDLTNSTAGERPVMATTIANGMPALQFSSASSHHLSRSSAFLAGQTGSFFAVLRSSAAAGGGITFSERSTVGGTTQVMQAGMQFSAAIGAIGNSSGAAGLGAILGNGSVSSNVFYILHQQSVGTSYVQELNGVDAGVTTAFGGANNGNWFGDAATPHNAVMSGQSSAAGVFGTPWNGYIAEVLVYDGVTLTTVQSRQVNAYLGNKYGITV